MPFVGGRAARWPGERGRLRRIWCRPRHSGRRLGRTSHPVLCRARISHEQPPSTPPTSPSTPPSHDHVAEAAARSGPRRRAFPRPGGRRPRRRGGARAHVGRRSSRTSWRRWWRPRRGSAGGRRWWWPPTTSGRATWRASCAPTWRRAASATTPRGAPATPRTSRRRPTSWACGSRRWMRSRTPSLRWSWQARSRSPRRCRTPRCARRASRSTAASEVDLDEVGGLLVEAGYERTDQVEERGQFAIRGGILDVFRPPRTGRRGWSCSATRSSRSAGSRPSPSAPWARRSRWSCRPRPSWPRSTGSWPSWCWRTTRSARTSAELLPLDSSAPRWS